MQPVDGEWTISEPFEMKRLHLEGYGEVLTGRGSQDDKGNTFAAMSGLLALSHALKFNGFNGLISLPINVIFVLEGEEEIGSKGFPSFLESNKNIFKKAVVMLCADGSQPKEDKGGIMLSNRGSVGGELIIQGATSDLHSGTFGGSILNPLVAASRIVASMHDPVTNKINVKHFYDGVVELTSEQRAELGTVDDVIEAEGLGVSKMVGEEGKDLEFCLEILMNESICLLSTQEDF